MSGRVTTSRPACVWPLAAQLGEGPLWDPRDGRLWFVDIFGGSIHWFDPRRDQSGTVEVGGLPGFIVPASGGGFVVGSENRLVHFDGEQITREIARIELPDRHRLNDGTVDCLGRLWFGSMDMDARGATGQVFVLHSGEVRPAGGDAPITNGPAVSCDGRLLYHVDTVGGSIVRFDLTSGPMLRDGKNFVTIESEHGTPDGVCVDSEDHIWVGLWGGWAARRYAPDGQLVQEIELPCANVTKVALGGSAMRTAFITTARAGLSAHDLEGQREAGGLFACEIAVPGIAPTAVATTGGV